MFQTTLGFFMSVELHAGDLLCAARIPEANECLQIAARPVPLADMPTYQAEYQIWRLPRTKSLAWVLLVLFEFEREETNLAGLIAAMILPLPPKRNI
jgi:hypothetical protein